MLACLLLIVSDESLFEHCLNFHGVLKLVLLKVSIGAIVVEGLIENLLYTNGEINLGSDDVHSAADKALRAYCKF